MDPNTPIKSGTPLMRPLALPQAFLVPTAQSITKHYSLTGPGSWHKKLEAVTALDNEELFCLSAVDPPSQTDLGVFWWRHNNAFKEHSNSTTTGYSDPIASSDSTVTKGFA